MYSGSRSVEGFTPFFNTTPEAASSSRRPSKASKPTTSLVKADTFTTVTEPLGSAIPSPYPSRGSPSSAVRTVLLSAKVTMSGCTPVSTKPFRVRVPSELQVNRATRPASLYPSA